MGNNNSRPVTFRQSQFDFPLTVALGEKSPSWGLSRWGGSSPLRFLPVDDEGFALRGDRRRRSHRFTILSDGSFEYDVILEREPETNIVVLPMEGAEQFDFFRQPDFIKDPFLAGSYAVYKKETLIGEGTGKLCHIHRPEIIDARGRRCWGELSVVDNCLCITIPEQWLAVAKFPVVVDPMIGTETIGSQITGDDPPYQTFDSPTMDNNVVVNRFLVTEKAIGKCTFQVYCYWPYSSPEFYPVLYTDNNNIPYMKKSKNEEKIITKIGTYEFKGWRNGTFQIEGEIDTGSYIWYGARARLFTTRFDYVDNECYKYYSGWNTDLPIILDNDNFLVKFGIQYSWYFTYDKAPVAYYCFLSEGIKASDWNIRKLDYERKNKDIVHAPLSLDKKGQYTRQIFTTASAIEKLFRSLFLSVILRAGITVSDYFFCRFLKAREEIKIKSIITREMTLESKIQ